MNNDKHTPTPWNFHRHYTPPELMDVTMEDGRVFCNGEYILAHGDKILGSLDFRSNVGGGWPMVGNVHEWHANAAFVLKAVNEYDAMKARIAKLEHALCVVHCNAAESPEWIRARIDTALTE